MTIKVKGDTLSIEEAVFTYLLEETGDLERAAVIGASGYIEAVLSANPGLAGAAAANGDCLPHGTVINFPAIPDTRVVQSIKLWD